MVFKGMVWQYIGDDGYCLVGVYMCQLVFFEVGVNLQVVCGYQGEQLCVVVDEGVGLCVVVVNYFIEWCVNVGIVEVQSGYFEVSLGLCQGSQGLLLVSIQYCQLMFGYGFICFGFFLFGMCLVIIGGGVIVDLCGNCV